MCKLILTYDLFGENSEKITQIIQNNTIFNIHSINGVYFDLIKMLHNIKKSKQNIQENLLEVNEHIENNYINLYFYQYVYIIVVRFTPKNKYLILILKII